MMELPEGRKSFMIGLAVLIQFRRVTDTQPASHVAVASTRYAYLRRAVIIKCYLFTTDAFVLSINNGWNIASNSLFLHAVNHIC